MNQTKKNSICCINLQKCESSFIDATLQLSCAKQEIEEQLETTFIITTFLLEHPKITGSHLQLSCT